MAGNIFSKTNDWFDKPKRNTFDLSFQNNLTMKFGALYPCFCKEVVPGDSFSIKPTFGLRLMPMMFPIQTRMKAYLHFFYVRNRNLWKDWPDFIGHTKDGLVKPYVNPMSIRGITKKTGSLYDYLNLPTTVSGEYGGSDIYRVTAVPISNTWHSWNWTSPTNFTIGSEFGTGYTASGSTTASFGAIMINDLYRNTGGIDQSPSDSPVPGATPFRTPLANTKIRVYVRDLGATVQDQNATVRIFVKDSGGLFRCAYKMSCVATREESIVLDGVTYSPILLDIGSPAVGETQAIQTVDEINEAISLYGSEYFIAVNSNTFIRPYNGTTSTYWGSGAVPYPVTASVNARTTQVADIDDVIPRFFNDIVHVDALPFRAYESIYNSFYRNQQNDPFMIPQTDPVSGEVTYVREYNKVLQNTDGGVDDFDYKLHYRNWEMDFLTSALPSPIQGNAPLVGVTSTGILTFENEDGSTFRVRAITGEDGNQITGISVMDGTRDAAGNATIRNLVDMVSNGISISDFRNVNSLQRWLEANMRRGFRYIDQIETHYGVQPKYEEMDLPEFIGGVSQPIEINQVSATAQSNGVNIGDYAGQGFCIGTSNHRIEKYCDEHGFIMGIISVAPVPNYSQLIPKMFLKTDTLDYFFPEFGHISPQAITYREVCPVQTHVHDLAEGSSSLNDTFGYQRAWYDYIASVDEVHGDFRTTMQSFLMNRVFDDKPILGADFIHINPDHLNDVFADTNDNDKILGQIYFDVSAKRPIPMFGIPRLE